MKGFHHPSCSNPKPLRPRFSPEELRQEPLLLLRFTRLVAEGGGELAPEELAFLREHRWELQKVYRRDLTREWDQLLLSPAVFPALNLLVETGLLEVLIPELLQGQGMEQSFIHPDDVLTHNLRTCSIVKPRLHLRLAGLLHDVGKPGYYVEDPLVGRRFPEHQFRSAELVPVILGRFAYPRELVDRVKLLVKNHMFIWVPHHGLEPIRELIERVGKENIEDLIELVTSDREAIWGERIKSTNRALWKALALVK